MHRRACDVAHKFKMVGFPSVWPRYYRHSDKQRITEAFHLGQLPDGFVLPPWDYNVAPTTFQPVIRNDNETGERELVLMRWGLIPDFAKSLAWHRNLIRRRQRFIQTDCVADRFELQVGERCTRHSRGLDLRYHTVVDWCFKHGPLIPRRPKYDRRGS
jgi:hypothetical protein